METMYQDYANTVYRLANQYAKSDGIFKLSEKQIEELAAFLSVDSSQLKEKLKYSDDIEINDTCNYLFQSFIRVFTAVNCCQNINSKKYDDLRILINDLREIFYWVEGLNIDFSTVMFLKEQEMTRKYALQDWKDHIIFSWLELLPCCDMNPLKHKLIPFIVDFILHDTMGRLHSIYLIEIMLIIQDSPYINQRIKEIAKDLYNYFLEVFRNSKLIGIQFNSLHPYEDIESRGKKDNTTQLQVIYSYSNYDVYCLRLDLPHKGQNEIHFNNRTPGAGNGSEVNSCIFQKDEVEKILANNPEANDFFIEYNNVYALKERSNCILKTEEEHKLFQDIERKHSHVQIKSKEYGENEMIQFVELLGYFFPKAPKTIDTEYEYAIKCFNYNKLQEQLSQLVYMYFYCDIYAEDLDVQKKIDQIIEYLKKNAVFDAEEDFPELHSLDGVLILLNDLKEKLQWK